MKEIILLIVLFSFGTTFAQSKKEQIEILNIRLDSLKKLISDERETNNSKIKNLNALYEGSKNEVSILKTDNNNLNIIITQKDKENIQLKVSLNNKFVESNELKNEVKNKSDTIAKITEELNKIKASKSNVFIPENNYYNLLQKFKNKDKNIEEQKKWIYKILTDQNNILTDKCEEYVNDVAYYHSGYDGSIEEEELKSKWGNQYDLKYKNFDHLFETGNCGWMTEKLTKVEYLGELNDGDWFKLTIKGGCGYNDYSNTIDRVIKVIKENNLFLIDYIISPTGDFKDY